MSEMRASPAVSGEAERVVRHLARSGSHAVALAGSSCYALVQDGMIKPNPVFSVAAIGHALGRGWVVRRGETVVLTGAGASWLRRLRAGAEAFRAQHQPLASIAAEPASSGERPLLNEAESPLGWLRRRKDKGGESLISDAEFAAGERLRADHHFAGLSPSVTSRWEASGVTNRGLRGGPFGAPDMRDEVVAARQRVNRALAAVGPELSGILLDVCCHLKGLETAEREQGWPQRSGKVVLQLALSALARHYGFARSAGTAMRPVQHWGSDDYRPTLAQWREPGPKRA